MSLTGHCTSIHTWLDFFFFTKTEALMQERNNAKQCQEVTQQRATRISDKNAAGAASQRPLHYAQVTYYKIWALTNNCCVTVRFVTRLGCSHRKPIQSRYHRQCLYISSGLFPLLQASYSHCRTVLTMSRWLGTKEVSISIAQGQKKKKLTGFVLRAKHK